MSWRWPSSNKSKRTIKNCIQGCWFKRILWFRSQLLEVIQLLSVDVWIQRQYHTQQVSSHKLYVSAMVDLPSFIASLGAFSAPVFQWCPTGADPHGGRQFPALESVLVVLSGTSIASEKTKLSLFCFHSPSPSYCEKCLRFLPQNSPEISHATLTLPNRPCILAMLSIPEPSLHHPPTGCSSGEGRRAGAGKKHSVKLPGTQKESVKTQAPQSG